MILDNFNHNSIYSLLIRSNFSTQSYKKLISKEDILQQRLELLFTSYKGGKIFISENKGEIEALFSFKILDWDTTHFGFKCAVIDQYYFDNRVSSEVLKRIFKEILEYAKSINVQFLSMSVNSWDTIVSDILQFNKFRYILTWLDGSYTPTEKIPVLYPDHQVSLLNETEISTYQEIAKKQYFKGGRFYLDNNFEIEKVNNMYSELIYSSYKNEDIMLSYKINDEPVGLFVCKKIQIIGKKNSIKVAPLRFLVIRNDVRAKQIGKDLFARTLNYLSDKSDIITTGLEIHNLKSLNLHSSLKFKYNYTHNVFHWWNK